MRDIQAGIPSPFILVPIIFGGFLSGAFYLAEGGAIPFTIFQIALIIGLMLFFLSRMVIQNFEFHVYGLEKEYLLFLAVICLSIIYSPERGEAIFSTIRYVVLIVMTYLIYNSIRDEKEFRIICISIIVISFGLSLYNIFQFIINPDVAAFNYINQGEKLIRSRGVERDPNIFASNFFMPIMMLIAFIGEAKNLRKRLLLFLVVSIIILSVLLTYSRSAWVSIFFGTIIIVLYQKKYSFILYSVITFFVVFTLSESVRSVLFTIFERVTDIFAGSEDDSSRFRIMLLKASVFMWLDSYTFGIGHEGFSTVFKQYYPPQETAGVYEPHNEYYAVLAELGTIGFILFFYITWKIIRGGWKTVMATERLKKPNSIILGLFASFIAYVIFFQFLSGMRLHSICTFNIGLLFSYGKLVQIQQKRLILE